MHNHPSARLPVSASSDTALVNVLTSKLKVIFLSVCSSLPDTVWSIVIYKLVAQNTERR